MIIMFDAGTRVDPLLHAREPFDIIHLMTKMMKEAIEILRELPEEQQETIARAILDYASDDSDVGCRGGAVTRD